MIMDIVFRERIANEFRNCVNNTINRVTNNESTYRPFHTALLSEDAIFWSAFERSFSTSFGQRVIEEIAKIVAIAYGAENAERQVETHITIDAAYDDAIHDHIQAARENRLNAYAWNICYPEILATQPSGRTKEIRVISDMWWQKNGVDNYVSLKTVKPNIDQTAIAKEDCLHLKIANPNCNAYFGLPYNPYGESKADYAFNPPMKIFDFHNDSVVLIGRELWDTIGDSGCYDELIEIANSVGQETQEVIRRLRN